MKTNMTREEAQEKLDLKNSVMSPRCPLRHRFCIVDGPDGGYAVMTLGEAERNGFSIVK